MLRILKQRCHGLTRFLALSLISFLVVFFSSHVILAAEIEGIVLSENGPIQGGTVYAYRAFDELIADKPVFVSEPGNKPGFFEMQLPDDRYYFMARGTVDGKNVFSYHGANPINVDDSTLWLPFMAVPTGNEVVHKSSRSRLRGVVTFKGSPVSDARVSIYLPSDDPFKGLGVLTAGTDTSGSFELALEAGDYVAIARKRFDGQGMRPLKKGDLFCFFPGAILTIHEARMTEIEIPCYPKENLRAFLNDSALQLVKRTNADAVRLREKPRMRAQVSEIHGKVTDLFGDPVGDALVMAYKETTRRRFQMYMVRDKPTHMARTGVDGSFRLPVDERGWYTLVARERAGGAPGKGELFGLYEGNVSHAVFVESPNVEDINIFVGRVMSDQYVASNERNRRVLADKTFGDTVIVQDTIWRGEITIDGTVVVGRRATLTIAPGTRVRFVEVDRNRDGVGDGELRVLGRLVVKGNSASPVRFSSMARNPKPRGWSYVLFFTSSGRSVIEHGIFEHAFTGVQAHFAEVSIRNSTFRNNVEGIRFGRAHITIDHNDIRENTCGIRHHRFEDHVEITANNITNNEVGIFLVPSNQNTVGFSKERYEADKSYRGQPMISKNNISANSRYNYRLGERFRYDIILKNNWWGSTFVEDIERSIFDGSDDMSLGKVIIRPYLESPVEIAKERYIQ
ncbi:MAG: hypothetical protein GY854_09735 [Deltaproteobacteria bacterium]|nr:hypothetical protein [Deltaproteobacteria bacterium]